MHRSHVTSSPSTDRVRDANRGFGTVELLVAITVTALGITLASGLMLAGRAHIRKQQKELEATHAARASLEAILRELRLGGACLPETGDFIALEAVDGGDLDEITARFGITSESDMTCTQTTVSAAIAGSATTVPVDSTDGFSAGDLAYLRNTDGGGEYFVVTSVDTSAGTLGTDRALTDAYPATSGVYAIEERRFWIDEPDSSPPRLMMQVDGGLPQPFAIGVEKLNVEFELSDGTLIDEPGDDQTWRSIRQLHLTVSARSLSADLEGKYTHRELSVRIKPRNLIAS